MKKLIATILFLTLALAVIGCSTTPAETTPTTAPVVAKPTEPTVPPTTIPPTTAPPESTEPQTPDSYVNLSAELAGSRITITIDSPKIILSEDGLSIEMTLNDRKIYRNGYIVAAMLDNPLLEGETVFVHEFFYCYFFFKTGSDQPSLFHSIQFFPEEVRAALEDPNASVLNTRVCAEVCLPQSMGITLPHIDPARVFSYQPVPDGLKGEAKRLGASSDITYGEYTAIENSVTPKKLGISDETSMSVGEYHRLQREKSATEDRMSDEQKKFFEEKNIDLSDYWDLFSWFHNGFQSASDEDLIEALEACYRSYLEFTLGSDYPETFTLPPTAMNQQQLQKWFFDFAREYCLHEMPPFTLENGPWRDAGTYLYWLYELDPNEEPARYEISREYVEETVLKYFGIIPGDHRGDPHSWQYDEEDEIYYQDGVFRIKSNFFLLNSIEYKDGIYIVHAYGYASPTLPETEEEKQQATNDFLSGKRNGFTRTSEITVTFRLNPETNEPIFCSFDRIRNDDFPRV